MSEELLTKKPDAPSQADEESRSLSAHRFNPVPDIPATFSISAHHQGYLDAWRDEAATAICNDEWPGWPPPATFTLLERALSEAGAAEGTLWLHNFRNELWPRYHSGPHAETFLREIRQPAHSGLVGMVFDTEDSFADERPRHDKQSSSSIDARFGQKTLAFAAAPIVFGHRCRGVLSAVTLDSPAASLRLAPLELGAMIWGEEMDRLIDAAQTRRSGGDQ